MPAASPARTLAPGEGAMALFGDPPPDAPPTRTRAARPPDSSREIEPDQGAPAPLDSSRWVMVGWRCGSWKAGPPLTREQNAAVINTPRGPCARCGALHHRYGEGGQPLCPACRTTLNPPPE